MCEEILYIFNQFYQTDLTEPNSPTTRLRAYPKGACAQARPYSGRYTYSAVPLMYPPPTQVAGNHIHARTHTYTQARVHKNVSDEEDLEEKKLCKNQFK